MSIIAEFPDLTDIFKSGITNACCNRPALMIAMTARTGSTHLCAALADAAETTQPVEIFNPRGVVMHEKQRRQVETFSAYIGSLSRDPGGLFLFKASWQDFAPFAPMYEQIFPDLRIVYLNRLDVVAQAVSLFRAVVSEFWHDDGTRAPPQSAAALHDRFDLVRICRMIGAIEDEKSGWERFFTAENLSPPRLNYEDFADDVAVALRSIGLRFGLAMDGIGNGKPPLRKLSDALNEAWIAKVNHYRSGRFYSQVQSVYAGWAEHHPR